MTDYVQTVNSPREIADVAERLRRVFLETDLSPDAVLNVIECWAVGLKRGGLDVPGLAFLQLWLRRGTLEPILLRELGAGSLKGGWRADGQARFRAFPVGIIGHWPAGNIEIQPVLSMSCALIGGNVCLVRVPKDLVQITEELMQRFKEVDEKGTLVERVAMITYDHDRRDLHEAMAKVVDGAMIWGGEEAVSHVRTLPFPHWTRLAVFGPRLSVAAMDAALWNDPAARTVWCQRIARDVWQFDQQACSSPQTLFLERSAVTNVEAFVADLKRAFEEENRVHPRQQIDPARSSAICLARASWLLHNVEQRAWFPMSPDWTILYGEGTDIPQPVQNRTLTVLVVDDLLEVISKFDGTVQTLGLAISDPTRETALAEAAGRKGVDRIVKLGRMHVFGSPWDGADLIRPMVRVVRYVPSQNG
jgi:hypothetical protein